ncbi:flavin monoamine oxidase family protein [Myxococcus qinghaiensis]|uniref:flavin monoamine oxidase family protein n=1 Tax=Myxococcus qinghaiensis TaxID=2906758 RepID=UPI0020A7EA9C|nr:FAD-dependent oxidoreductase [Myxococcus qinghaiensis]MCP3169722.1 FAD-dependent oxidoreductase [Myxococcus qinghaiensis]
MSRVNPPAMDTGMDDGLQLDVAIIGAGVSGLYTGWRLLVGDLAPEGTRPETVHIFELSERLGGRIESVFLPGISLAAEIGGMRYLQSHEIVNSLITKVFTQEVTPVDFPLGDDSNHYRYLRGQRFKANEWENAQDDRRTYKTRYFLPDAVVGFTSDQLFNKIIYDVLMADPWFRERYPGKATFTAPYDYAFTLTAREWDDVKPNLTYHQPGPYDGLKVNDLGFWNLIKDQVGQEAYEFLSVAGGYYSNTINWNAAEAFPYLVGDFSNAEVKYQTLAGGYDQVGNVLAQRFLAQDPSGKRAHLWGQNGLRRIDPAPGGSPYKYILTVANAQSGKSWTVYAKAVVLAMPRRALELLEVDRFFTTPEVSEQVRKNLDSVISEPSFKLLMGFESPWWHAEFNALAGESITDLPMRQCYYFGTDPANSHSILLASYNDMRTTPFWSALMASPHRNLKRFKPRATRLASSESLAQVESLQAPAVMVQEAVHQLRELHGPENPVPDPYVSYFRNWTEDPYGGGYHAWQAGVSVRDVMPFMRRPDPAERLHICGEAYSDQQGWVEGAFCEAEKMLQAHFGLAWPSWLDSQYYLGW